MDANGSKPPGRIRQLIPDDKVQLQALYAGTRNPYREEDAAEVLAMNRRAIHARETNDRWSALPSQGHHVTDAEHRAFWVAEALANGSPELLGTVGLRIVGDSNTTDADTFELSGLPSLDEWMQAESIGEVRRPSHVWRTRVQLGAAEAANRTFHWAGILGLLFHTRQMGLKRKERIHWVAQSEIAVT
jgi:hypothetical protein